MYTRHHHLDVISSWPTTIPAPSYNVARRALARAGKPVVVPLPALNTLELLIQRDAWVLIDTGVLDRPVAAWTNFGDPLKRPLHCDATCDLHHYHRHAGAIAGRAVTLMAARLSIELQVDIPEGRIIPLPAR